MNKNKEKDSNRKQSNSKEHPFREELSDGGERDKIIKQQSSNYCGGL